MKQLMIIAMSLFSLFTIYSTHVNAADCKHGTNDGEIIRPEGVKGCKGVTDGKENDILYKLTGYNVIFFLISCVLFGVGIVLSKRKKEPTKKERIVIEFLCWLPFVSIFFFVIINIFENLM